MVVKRGKRKARKKKGSRQGVKKRSDDMQGSQKVGSNRFGEYGTWESWAFGWAGLELELIRKQPC